MFEKRSSYEFRGHHKHHTGDAVHNAIAAEVEKKLHVEVVPGTEILSFDDGNIQTTKGGKGSNNEGMTLVPQPSRDPHDPLNWTSLWKSVVVLNQAFFVIVSVMTPLSIAPLTPILVEEFSKSLSEVALLTGVAVIALGYANLIIIPFSNVFGRRLTSLICGLVCMLSNIWQASATSYNSFLSARVISGLGAAANESIMAVVVADVIFLHQRGAWMGLYFWSYFMGSFIGPIISGNIAAHVGWRWFFWVCTIAQGINLITLFFFFPETKYRRTVEIHIKHIAGGIKQTSNSTSKITREGDVTEARSAEHLEILQHVDKDQIILSSDAEALPTTLEEIVGRGTPSLAQRFLLVPRPDKHALKHIFRDLIAPVKIALYPIVLWASITMGFAANCVLDLNLTQSQVFAAPPYFFTPADVGLVNLAFVGGAAIGLLTAGPLSDWIGMKLTKQNNGIREPEMRLPALLPYIAGTIVGSVVVAFGFQNVWPWQAIVVIGFGLIGMIGVAVSTICITYAVDCYKPIAGEIMVIATICKNTFGFGMTYFINDWAVRSGYIGPIMLLGGLTFGTSIVGGVVFWTWGKSFRRWTMNSWVHDL